MAGTVAPHSMYISASDVAGAAATRIWATRTMATTATAISWGLGFRPAGVTGR
jgi:hypothetical protein